MKVQVKMWGNSLALRIPKSFATESKISLGTTVDVSLENGRIVVFPVAETEYSLDEMLAQTTPENLHGEISTGDAVGQEIW
ncbi:AbrB/MazE/SpoVT family DNA-binding domain-containing protein [soil metagenome]